MLTWGMAVEYLVPVLAEVVTQDTHVGCWAFIQTSPPVVVSLVTVDTEVVTRGMGCLASLAPVAAVNPFAHSIYTDITFGSRVFGCCRY